MVVKTYDESSSMDCSKPHDITALRIDNVESFLSKTFSAMFEAHTTSNSSKWPCCKANVCPSLWPLLAQIKKWVPEEGTSTNHDTQLPVKAHTKEQTIEVSQSMVVDGTTTIPEKGSAEVDSSILKAVLSAKTPATKEKYYEIETNRASQSAVEHVKVVNTTSKIANLSVVDLSNDTWLEKTPVFLSDNASTSRNVPISSTTVGRIVDTDIIELSSDDEDEQKSEIIQNDKSNHTAVDTVLSTHIAVSPPLKTCKTTLFESQTNSINTVSSLTDTSPLITRRTSSRTRLPDSTDTAASSSSRKNYSLETPNKITVVDPSTGTLSYRRVQVVHNNNPLSINGNAIMQGNQSKKMTLEKTDTVAASSLVTKKSSASVSTDADLSSMLTSDTFIDIDENDIQMISETDGDENLPDVQVESSSKVAINSNPSLSIPVLGISESSSEAINSNSDDQNQLSPSTSTTECTTSSFEEFETSKPSTSRNKCGFSIEEGHPSTFMASSLTDSTTLDVRNTCNDTLLPSYSTNSADANKEIDSFESVISDPAAGSTSSTIQSTSNAVSTSSSQPYQVKLVSESKDTPETLDYEMDSVSDEDTQTQEEVVLLADNAVAAVDAALFKNAPTSKSRDLPESDRPPQMRANTSVSKRNTSTSTKQSLSDLLVPRRTCKQRTVYCTDCQASFESKEDMDKHRMTHHLESAEDEADKNVSGVEDGVGQTRRQSKRKRMRSAKYREYASQRRKSQRQPSIDQDSDTDDDIIPAKPQSKNNDSENLSSETPKSRGRPRKRHVSSPASTATPENLKTDTDTKANKPGKRLVCCPYCNDHVSRAHRWEHLRRHCTLTKRELALEEEKKGKVDWPEVTGAVLVRRARSRSKGALTDTEGNGKRKRASSRAGTKTDVNSSDEEPISLKTTLRRKIPIVHADGATTSKAVDLPDGSHTDGEMLPNKRLKMGENMASNLEAPLPTTIQTNVSQLPAEKLNVETDEWFVANSSNTQDLVINSFSEPRNADMSIATEIISGDEDADRTTILEIPSAPASQISTLTATDFTPTRMYPKGSTRVSCGKCGKSVSRSQISYHMESRRCKKQNDTVNGDYETAEESQTEDIIDANITDAEMIRVQKLRKPGKCRYCGKEMLSHSLRNHVLKACAKAQKAKENGQELNYRSLEDGEDSQNEDVNTASNSDPSKVECMDCGLRMNEGALSRHLSKCPQRKKLSRTRRKRFVESDTEFEVPEKSTEVKARTRTLPREVKEKVNYNLDNVESDSETYVSEEESVPNEIRVAKNNENPTFNPDEAICKFYDCLYTPGDYFSYAQHLESHSEAVYHCTKCKKIFSCQANMLDHLKTHTRKIYYDVTGVSYAKDPNLQPTVILDPCLLPEPVVVCNQAQNPQH